VIKVALTEHEKQEKINFLPSNSAIKFVRKLIICLVRRTIKTAFISILRASFILVALVYEKNRTSYLKKARGSCSTCGACYLLFFIHNLKVVAIAP